MRIALSLIVLLLYTPAALGWGQIGHRVTGEIAAHYLSPAARVAVTEILGSETLARASTWPDYMRADPSTFWQETANPWHYVTIPPGKTYEDVGAPPEGDAFTALQRFSETLRDPDATGEDKALALRFIVHIVADLHQPLHVGTGADRGGNDFDVVFFGQPTNLHSVWDAKLIDRMQLSYTELASWLLADIDGSDFTAWNDPDPHTWMAESTKLRDRIYPEERELRWDYGFQWRDAVYRRLSQAGVRIAVYLNELFGEQAD